MSRDVHLFQPPRAYPEAPKDMWYQVPPKPKEPSKPKPIFPWENRAPKPTRVFAEPTRSPSPEPEPEPVQEPVADAGSASSTTTLEAEPAATPPVISSPDPWAGFQARTNAWDDVPEIERYMQSLQGPRKAKIQVLHNTSPPKSRSPASTRRPSLKLTDFPTEVERPSLPVTPAPIRRPSFWGEERDEDGNLPAADGVPQQEEWVRRFSSYPVPDFPALSPILSNQSGVLVVRCQYCGKQNPIAKLEELQRKQSEVLTAPSQLEEASPVPQRRMPESQSKDAVIQATEKALSPSTKAPKMPKPILKEPKFELVPKDQPLPDEVLSPTSVKDVPPSATHVETTDSGKGISPAAVSETAQVR
jgi:hypothetical protein